MSRRATELGMGIGALTNISGILQHELKKRGGSAEHLLPLLCGGEEALDLVQLGLGNFVEALIMSEPQERLFWPVRMDMSEDRLVDLVLRLDMTDKTVVNFDAHRQEDVWDDKPHDVRFKLLWIDTPMSDFKIVEKMTEANLEPPFVDQAIAFALRYPKAGEFAALTSKEEASSEPRTHLVFGQTSSGAWCYEDSNEEWGSVMPFLGVIPE